MKIVYRYKGYKITMWRSTWAWKAEVDGTVSAKFTSLSYMAVLRKAKEFIDVNDELS